MLLDKHIGPEQILLQVKVPDKWALIERMADALLEHPVSRRLPDEVKNRIRPALLRREEERSTYVGDGYAFPHARVRGLRDFAIALAVLAKDMEYDGSGSAAVRLACMVVTPEEDPTVGVRVMGLIARRFSDPETRRFVLSATDAKEVYALLQVEEAPLSAAILARDIMHPPFMTVHPETPLRQVTREMQKNHMEAVAVLDRDGRIVGEITCDALFRRGLPDFFSQLTGIGFARNFDPFEKYFQEDAHASAGDVMSSDFAAVSEDATLMEIVYLLSVKNYAKAHVVRDGVKVGTIDRIAVLDRVLNL